MSSSKIKLITGANAPLGESATLKVAVSCIHSPAELDVSCFMVGSEGKVSSDDYFVFYNQPADPDRIVQFIPKDKLNSEFIINLSILETSPIQKCIFAITLDGAGTFADVIGCRITAETSVSEVVYEITEGNAETSLVLAELYQHSNGFKLRAVGRGFHGGLKPLAEAHGVNVTEEEDVNSSPSPAAPTIQADQARANASSVIEASRSEVASTASRTTPSKINLNKMDLLKQKVSISLFKKNIEQQKARVAVIFDASGSMYELYTSGVVQRAFERILAIAASMDDDGMMDVWFFASKSQRMKSVNENEYENYVKNTYPAPRLFGGLGTGNNEPIVMADIIKKYTKEEPSSIPTYVVFFSDGGIYETRKISKLLIDSSGQNIFWQFVGLGNANFGVLRQLDDLRGRVIDNADFFALDDLDNVSDEDLYDRLFDEYPQWLKDARAKGII